MIPIQSSLNAFPSLLRLLTLVLFTATLLPSVAAQGTTVIITAAPSEPTAEPQYTSTPDFTSAVLNASNTYRDQHSAGALSWNDSLADFASSYLGGASCDFAHSGGPDGENLAEGYVNATDAVDAWGDERAEYDWDNPGFSEQTGHFTQLVWKATTTVGCGRAWCGEPQGWYVVCEYWPRGNVEGEYDQNVGKQISGPQSTGAPSSSGGGSDCKQGEVCDVAAGIAVERGLMILAGLLAMGLATIL